MELDTQNAYRLGEIYNMKQEDLGHYLIHGKENGFHYKWSLFENQTTVLT